MFDSSLITYAVSLHFSQKINDIVISTLQTIADKTGNSFMIENKIPPHITIGAFHAAREEEAKLLQLVEGFALIICSIRISSILKMVNTGKLQALL